MAAGFLNMTSVRIGQRQRGHGRGPCEASSAKPAIIVLHDAVPRPEMTGIRRNSEDPKEGQPGLCMCTASAAPSAARSLQNSNIQTKTSKTHFRNRCEWKLNNAATALVNPGSARLLRKCNTRVESKQHFEYTHIGFVQITLWDVCSVQVSLKT